MPRSTALLEADGDHQTGLPGVTGVSCTSAPCALDAFNMLDTGETLRSTAAVAHIIQIALTPVFLLSGIAMLLNVFSSRLARVADRVHAVSDVLRISSEMERSDLQRRLKHLLRRSHLLDSAVALGAAGGVATCAAVILLFLGTLRDQAIDLTLFAVFGSALICTAGALTAFLIEVLIASHGVRDRVTTATLMK